MPQAAQIPLMMPIPPRTPPSHIAAVGHDGGSLYVQFHGEPPTVVHRYPGVPAQHAEAIKNDPHPGQYFHRAIRSARYPHEKIG